MRTRSWPIRAKFIAMLLTPMVSLIALWIFATNLTFASASSLMDTQTNYEEAGKPSEKLIGELQRERRLTQAFLGSPRSDGQELAKQRLDTNTAVAAFRYHVTTDRMDSAANDVTRQRINQALAGLDRLAGIRGSVDQRQLDRASAFQLYNGLVSSAYQIYLSLPALNEPSISRDSHAVISLSRAREVLAQEDAFLSGAAASGRFTGAEPGQLAGIIGVQRFLYADAVAELPTADRTAFGKIMEGAEATRLRLLEDRLITEARAGQPVPIDMATWQNTYNSLVEQLRDAEFDAGERVLEKGRPVGIAIMVRLGLAGVLGLIAIAFSVTVAIRVGRSLVSRLMRLEAAANDLSTKRLPDVVRRLRHGEHVEVAEQAPQLDFGDDEIGRVGRAFSTVQRTAIESAVNEARLRTGLNKVFLNIARRSQALLHRQLSLLDAMERDTIDPAKLQELFRIDHLATRMRRHSEDLVILAGAAPVRGWRNPVPLIDVVRGSISEVEDYARITPQAMPEVAIAGPAVADVIHLLSELLENAAAFSPPHTPVLVGGQLVPSGLAIDIEDRGLGMPPEAIEEANERLAHPPEFDPANSARLGLFVVATLAARHNIAVNLRRSPYGGITAVVLVPPGLITGEPELGLPAGRPVLAPGLSAVPFGPTNGWDGPINGWDGPAPGRPRSTRLRQIIAPDAPVRSDPGTGKKQSEPPAAVTAAAGPTTEAPVDPIVDALADPVPGALADPTVDGQGDAPGTGVILIESRRGAALEPHPAEEDTATLPTVPVDAPNRRVDSAPAAPTAEPATGRLSTPTAQTPTVAEKPATGVVELTVDGLPKRRRQANLAPQLRDDPPPVGTPLLPRSAPAEPPAPRRSPEQIRSMMSALQDGTRRGRKEAVERSGEIIAPPTVHPAEEQAAPTPAEPAEYPESPGTTPRKEV